MYLISLLSYVVSIVCCRFIDRYDVINNGRSDDAITIAHFYWFIPIVQQSYIIFGIFVFTLENYSKNKTYYTLYQWKQHFHNKILNKDIIIQNNKKAEYDDHHPF